jgi:hypothetical protein
MNTEHQSCSREELQKEGRARVIICNDRSSGNENGGSEKLHFCEVEGLKA